MCTSIHLCYPVTYKFKVLFTGHYKSVQLGLPTLSLPLSHPISSLLVLGLDSVWPVPSAPAAPLAVKLRTTRDLVSKC